MIRLYCDKCIKIQINLSCNVFAFSLCLIHYNSEFCSATPFFLLIVDFDTLWVRSMKNLVKLFSLPASPLKTTTRGVSVEERRNRVVPEK